MGLNTWYVLQAVEGRDVQEADSSFAGLFICAQSGCGDPRISVSLKTDYQVKASTKPFLSNPFQVLCSSAFKYAGTEV